MSHSFQPVPVLPPTPEDEDSMAGTDIRSKPNPFVVTQPASGNPAQSGLIDTPTSPFSSFVLSRFEFEDGKGNEGTKILMVEWDSATVLSADTSAGVGADGSAHGGAGAGSTDRSSGRNDRSGLDDWVVAWEGKTNNSVLPVWDAAAAANCPTTKRVYFLLPPGVHIPPMITITKRDTATTSEAPETAAPASDDAVLRSKPLPAIFPASLGPDNKDAGLRGVLHTIWAKQRLADLEAEIEAEMKSNSESIGLQIALQEHEWIIEHFGVGAPLGPKTGQAQLPSPQSPAARAAPRSPIGGKLGEKLRGLRLATSPADLAAASQASKAAAFATRSAQGTTAAATATKAAVLHPRAAPYTSIDPPASMHSSLDAVLHGEHDAPGGIAPSEAVDGEDELFALPMSPRSPEMPKSPFSFL